VFRVVLLAQKEVPQSSSFGLFLELFHDGDDGRPSFLKGVFRKLGVVEVFRGKTVVLKVWR
jgi:hypothetical protein